MSTKQYKLSAQNGLNIETIFWTQYIVFLVHAQFAGVELISAFGLNLARYRKARLILIFEARGSS